VDLVSKKFFLHLNQPEGTLLKLQEFLEQEGVLDQSLHGSF
jgi:hypothetical protein